MRNYHGMRGRSADFHVAACCGGLSLRIAVAVATLDIHFPGHGVHVMHVWPVHDAKAHFSELLEAYATLGPQTITQRGTEMAVVVGVSEWKRLNHTSPGSLKELLLADAGRFELPIPPRGRGKHRQGAYVPS
jgi:prevent-host-death family protein